MVREVVVGQHHRRRLARDLGAGRPHRHADVGTPERRRIVDPVACHRDDVTLPSQRVGDPQLGVRRAPGEHDLPRSREQPRRAGRRVIASSSVAADHPRLGRGRCRPAGDRRGGQPVVAGDDDDADPGPVAPRDGAGHLRPGRVDHRDQPDQAQVALGGLAAGPATATPVARRRATASTRRPLRGVAVDALDGVDPGVRHVAVATTGCTARTSSGAPLVCSARPSSRSRRRSTSLAAADRSGTWRRRPVRAAATPAPQSAAAPAAAPPRWDRRWRRPAGGAAAFGSGAAASSRAASAAVRRPTGRLRIDIDGALGRPDLDDPHPVTGERPGLVGADNVGRTERLDGAETLHQRAAPGQLPDAGCQRERDRRQQPLGDVGDEQPDREDRRRSRIEAGGDADRHERRGHRAGHARDQPRNTGDLALERAVLRPHALGQARHPAELCPHARRQHYRLRLAAGAGRAAEHEVRGGERIPARGMVACRALDRHRLSVSVDMSTSTVPATRRASAEIRSPSSMTTRSPTTRSAAATLCRVPSRTTVAVTGRYSRSASTARSA